MNGCLDHVIWACADLERAVKHFEALTGVAPRYGGLHAGGSTHNALVSLGRDACRGVPPEARYTRGVISL